MLFLLLDILLSYTSLAPTFFILINILLYTKKDIFSFLLIPLILDLLIVNTYFLNTILFTALFLLIKHLKITKLKFSHYLLLITIIYIIYILTLGLISSYSIFYLLKFIMKNYFINLIFYALSYKLIKPYIKLSRWSLWTK